MAGERVLIAEDQLIVAEDLAQTLRGMGYEVADIVTSGTAAITKVAQLKPDIVLMDIGLEGEKDGVMAAAVIGKRFDVPVVFVTAHTDRKTVDRARIANPSGYVVKPFDAAKLQVAIQQALQKPAAAAAPAKALHEKSSILFVGESDQIQAAVINLLGTRNRMKLATSFAHARRMLESATFDLLVIDISLGDAENGAAIRALRRELNVKTPIIAMGEGISQETVAFLKPEGVSAFLNKTQLEARLVAEVEKVLGTPSSEH